MILKLTKKIGACRRSSLQSARMCKNGHQIDGETNTVYGKQPNSVFTDACESLYLGILQKN